VRAVGAALRGAAAEAWANRQAFWLQVTVMVVNDVAWIVFWALFFRRVGSLRGWDLERVLLLWAVLTTVAGLALGFLANARRIAQYARDGSLDAVLALPVSPLPYLLVRRLDTTNLGDLAFGLVLFAVGGRPTPQRVLLFAAGVACGTLLLTGFLVLVESLAFFTRRSEAGELAFHAVLLLASYPIDVFAGATKLALYTVVPAAFVAAVPARLVDQFDLRTAALLLAASVGFAAAGWATFTAGLRRYTSGAAWTRP
jgi:ABC-2 type transport system permease protein